MASKEIPAVVSAAGVLGTFATAFSRAVLAHGGTEREIYEGLKNEGLINRYAIVVTSRRDTRPEDCFDGYRSVNFTTVRPGVSIDEAIKSAIQIAAREDIDLVGEVTVEFGFNGRTISVNATSDPDVVYREWAEVVRRETGSVDKA